MNKFIVFLILLFPLFARADFRADNIRLNTNTISTTNTNGDLILDFNGTGKLQLPDLSASTVPYLDASKKLTSSAVTPTELGFVSGVTSSLCGINQSCTLTTKTLTSPTINSANMNYGTATNASRLLLPSDTTTNLAALTNTSGLLAYDTTLLKPVYNNGSTWTAVGSGSGGGGTFTNLLTNGDFAQTTTGWTASGGTFTTVPSGVNYMGVGTNNATWDSSAAGQTLTSPSYLIGNGYAGTNALYRCKVWNKSGATYTMGVWDGATLKDVITIDPGTTPKYVEIADSFSSSSGVPTAIRFTSVASNEPLISIADCYIGVNFNLASGVVMADVTNTTGLVPSAGFGSVTSPSYSYNRIGDKMEVTMSWVNGTVAGTTAAITLPFNIDTTKLPSNASGTLVGLGGRMVTVASRGFWANNDAWAVFYDGSTNNQVFVTANEGSSAFVKLAGNALASTSDAVSVTFKVPIAGWTSTSAGVRADNSNVPWTNYTPTFTGFGAVTTSNLQWRRNGQNLQIQGSFITGTNTASTASITLPPGLTVDSNFVAQSGTLNLVGMALPSLTSSAGFSVLTAAGQSTLNFSAFSASGINPMVAQTGSGLFSTGPTSATFGLITVPIQGWTENQNAPMLVGTVFSNTGGQERIERANVTIASSSTCTINSQSGAWLTSTTPNATGDCTLNIAAGMFSSANFSCSGMAKTLSLGSTDSDTSAVKFVSKTQTSIRVQTNRITSSPGIADNLNFDIICMGAR